MTIFRFSLAASFALLVAGCGVQSPKGDDRICATPPPLDLAAAAKVTKSWEQIELTDSCIHRWGYRLAKSPGTNRDIASAVLGACRDALLRESDLMFRENAGKAPSANDERAMMTELRDRYFETALFRVTQARAGKCEPV